MRRLSDLTNAPRIPPWRTPPGNEMSAFASDPNGGPFGESVLCSLPVGSLIGLRVSNFLFDPVRTVMLRRLGSLRVF